MAMTQIPGDFGFGADEEMLRDLARKFLDENCPITELRKWAAGDPLAVYERGERPGWSEPLWREMVELGWTGLAVPEEAGGAGFKAVGWAALVEEVGRHALPSPLIATLNATHVLRAVGGSAAAGCLSRIASGETATLAITDSRGRWESFGGDVVATADGDGLRLSGRACFVQDAFKARLLVTAARQAERIVLCAVPADAPGVGLSQDHIHDLTRDQATVAFTNVRVPAADIVSRDAEPVIRAAWPSILVSVSADLCGAAEWQLQTTVEYAKTRKQFDHPIGFFQAVKHPLVDAMVMIDRARSLLYHAAAAIDAGDESSPIAARMAKSAASDAGRYVSDRSVQLHGGIGFTWESDIHIYFKRSLHDQALYGDGVHQRRQIADHLIGPIGPIRS